MSVEKEILSLSNKLNNMGLTKEANRLKEMFENVKSKSKEKFEGFREKNILPSDERMAIKQLRLDMKKNDFESAKETLKGLGVTDEFLYDKLESLSKENNFFSRMKMTSMLRAILQLRNRGVAVDLNSVEKEMGEEIEQVPDDAVTEVSEMKKKSLPTSDEESVSFKNSKYKYFYNEQEQGFQVAKGSKDSVGTVIKAKNEIKKYSPEYNRRLDVSYKILHEQFERENYDISSIPFPTIETKYPGSASSEKYAFNPKSIGLKYLGNQNDNLDHNEGEPGHRFFLVEPSYGGNDAGLEKSYAKEGPISGIKGVTDDETKIIIIFEDDIAKYKQSKKPMTFYNYSSDLLVPGKEDPENYKAIVESKDGKHIWKLKK